MEKDSMAEWSYGEGAIKTMAKFMVLDIGRNMPGPVICGGVFTPLLDESKWPPKNNEGDRTEKDGRLFSSDELWVAELIIIPKFKFHKPTIEQGWGGMELGQKMCSQWGDATKWTQIFPVHI